MALAARGAPNNWRQEMRPTWPRTPPASEKTNYPQTASLSLFAGRLLAVRESSPGTLFLARWRRVWRLHDLPAKARSSRLCRAVLSMAADHVRMAAECGIYRGRDRIDPERVRDIPCPRSPSHKFIAVDRFPRGKTLGEEKLPTPFCREVSPPF